MLLVLALAHVVPPVWFALFNLIIIAQMRCFLIRCLFVHHWLLEFFLNVLLHIARSAHLRYDHHLNTIIKWFNLGKWIIFNKYS